MPVRVFKRPLSSPSESSYWGCTGQNTNRSGGLQLPWNKSKAFCMCRWRGERQWTCTESATVLLTWTNTHPHTHTTDFACCSANTTTGAKRGVFKHQQELLRSASRKQWCVLYERLSSAIWWRQPSKVPNSGTKANTSWQCDSARKQISFISVN